jgi:hypothetical protein
MTGFGLLGCRQQELFVLEASEPELLLARQLRDHAPFQ